MNKNFKNIIKSMKGGNFHAIKLCSKSRGTQTLGRLRGDIKALGQSGKNQVLAAAQRRPCLRCGLVFEHARTSQNCLCEGFVQGAEK